MKVARDTTKAPEPYDGPKLSVSGLDVDHVIQTGQTTRWETHTYLAGFVVSVSTYQVMYKWFLSVFVSRLPWIASARMD